MKTFYIAASSEILDAVRIYANILQGYGLKWFCDHDWTEDFEDHEANDGPLDSMRRADQDIFCAKNADYFIFIDTHPIISIGANREYGARMGARRRIIRISNQPLHMFDYSSFVDTYETFDAFIEREMSRG